MQTNGRSSLQLIKVLSMHWVAFKYEEENHVVLCFVMIERKRKRTLYTKKKGKGREPIPKEYKANKSKGTHVMKESSNKDPTNTLIK
jgi:hypothetical protein